METSILVGLVPKSAAATTKLRGEARKAVEGRVSKDGNIDLLRPSFEALASLGRLRMRFAGEFASARKRLIALPNSAPA